MEIPARGANFEWSKQTQRDQNHLQDHLQNCALGNGYDRLAGIRNVNYGNEPSNMICETIFTLADNVTHPYRLDLIPKETQTAMKYYIDQLYDSNWKKQQDEWIIMEGILQMYFDGLAFFVQPVLLWPFDQNNQTLWRDSFHREIPDHYIMQDSMESVLAICGNNPFTGQDPGYHSNPAGQQVIADNWYRRITQDHGIN
jgi:hypothetical protein